MGIIGWRSAAGAADLRPGNPMEGVSIQYEFETLPPKAEGGPGETGAEGTVLVTASRGEWLARWRPGPAWKLREDDFRAGPLDPPRCSSSDAWKATGLPTDRTFTVRYHNERAHHPRTPGVWKFDVGRSALAVDAGNCALLGAWE